jgi:transcriptional regulator with XRE-family HTH domain
MGRPTFTIDQTRLRALREEQGLTQAAVAGKVARQMRRQETDSSVRHYQRIEETGKTSIVYAKALAAVLGGSVPLLQGIEDPDPYAYLQYVQKLIQNRLENGENTGLQALLERHADSDREQALQYLAEDIAERIEQALLVRNPAMIAGLVKLTGLSETDLLAPASVRGFWFLSARSNIFSCCEVVDGVSLNYRITEVMQEFLGQRGNDSTIRMWHDSPWIRLEIRLAQGRDTMLVDFTRCLPDGAGLRWTAPSWRDSFFLEPAITASAWTYADVVTSFSGRTVPASPDRLRLLVDVHNGNHGKALGRMVVDGDFDEMPESLREGAAKEASTRILFLSWLTAGLRTALMPNLVSKPASEWYVHVNGRVVDISLRHARYRSSIYAELQYRITLAEETGPGLFETVPVRETALDQLRQAIESWLAAGDAPADDAGPKAVFEAL